MLAAAPPGTAPITKAVMTVKINEPDRTAFGQLTPAHPIEPVERLSAADLSECSSAGPVRPGSLLTATGTNPQFRAQRHHLCPSRRDTAGQPMQIRDRLRASRFWRPALRCGFRCRRGCELPNYLAAYRHAKWRRVAGISQARSYSVLAISSSIRVSIADGVGERCELPHGVLLVWAGRGPVHTAVPERRRRFRVPSGGRRGPR